MLGFFERQVDEADSLQLDLFLVMLKCLTTHSSSFFSLSKL